MKFCNPIAVLGLILFLGAAGSASSQPATATADTGTLHAESILRASDLQADVAILRHAYVTLHPGLFRYNTPAQMDEAFHALELQFQRDQTLAEAYLGFSRFAAKVKCGHTYANFYNQAKAVQDALFRGGRVPFYFRWLAGKMIITKSFAPNPHLQTGTEVLTINGTPVTTILEHLMTVARADGNNDAKRVASMEVQGTDRYEAFDVFFPLLFPFRSSSMTLRVRVPAGNAESEITVQSLSLEDRIAAMTVSEGSGKNSNEVGWEFQMLDDRIASVRMPSWVLYNSKWNWKAFLDTSFKAMVSNKTADLVIDLRGNEGGSDVGDEIISHLITKAVPRQAVVRRVRYRKVPDELVKYLDTWDPSFRDWGGSVSDSAAGFYTLRRDADDDIGGIIKPKLPTFGGRLWVLVGPTNSSATFEFAQTVKQNHLGTLVGQPTGGNQRGINGGAFFFLRLPHSGIELDLPLIGQFPVDDRPDEGLQPDILVNSTVEDIIAGRDVEMNTVRAMSRNPKH